MVAAVLDSCVRVPIPLGNETVLRLVGRCGKVFELCNMGMMDDMKQTDINRCKMTGEWFKHVRRKWRKPVNKARRVFLKKEQKRQEDEV